MRTLILLLFSAWLLVNPVCWATDTLIVKHYQNQARYELGIKVLDLALSKLNRPYLIQGANSKDINEARGEAHVIDGLLDIQFMISTKEREKSLIPIHIPIYRGMLGLRLLLVKHEKHDEMQSINNLEELQQHVGGHGKHWSDLPIYAHNQLPVVTNVNYQSLFKQLASERFDYFHRGILEIWDEQKQHSDTLRVADNVMLFYPQPTYFYVSKQRPELAKLIKKGLNIAMADGSFKALFLKYVGADIRRAKLESRTLIVLDNPILPNNTPPIDMSWWLPKTFQTQIQQSLHNK